MPLVVVTFTLLFGAAVAITVFTSAEILLSEAAGSGAAGAGAAGASLAGAAGAAVAGGFALLLATLLELSELPVAGLALVSAVEAGSLSVLPSLARFRAARRSDALFFLDGLAWSEEGVVVSFCATLGAGAAAGGVARAAALAAAASLTGAEAGAEAVASDATAPESEPGGGTAANVGFGAGVARATCIACSLCATYRYSPPPKIAARAIPTTILPAGEGVIVEFIIGTRSLQVTLMFYIRRFVTPVSAMDLRASQALHPVPRQRLSN